MTPTLNPIRRHREHCAAIRQLMSDYIDGGLDERAASRVARHVRWCPNCRRMLANLRRTIGGLSALGELSEPPDPGVP